MSASPGRVPDAPQRRSASEEVADAIRTYVFAQGLVPGDRLGREEDLARQFGVSRPTLREALRLLSSSYLVRASKGPGGGIFVAATAEQGIGRILSESVQSMLLAQNISIDELLETRMLLEVPLAGLAAQRATDDDIARLHGLLDDVESFEGDAARVLELDTRLHRLIAEVAGNRLAAAFMEWVGVVLQPSLHELIAPAVVDTVVIEQHRDVARAIERGDPTAAERAMREHLVYLHDLVTAVRRTDV